MANTIIENLSDRDEELFNVVTGRGPGDGLNRMEVTLKDAASIASYGERHTTVDFADVADLADLTTKTQDYLDAHKNPSQELEVTYFYDHRNPPNFERGDTVRVVDQTLGFAVTAEIQELDWGFDEVALYLGTPSYNLIDELIRKPEEEERERRALGLPVPVGFRAQKAFPGVALALNPYSNSRAVGVEIHASGTAGFTPTNATLKVKSPGTRFVLEDLPSGSQFYFKARSYDGAGQFSDFTEEVAAISGYLSGVGIEDGSLDITPFASEMRPPRNVLSLPDVTLTTNYLLGDLVVYDDGTNGPRLYELISETGDPNTDWTPLSASDLAARNTAHQVVYGQVEVGAIGVDELAANSVNAEKIQAGEVKSSKITVDGEIAVTQTGQTSGAFSVKNGATEVMRMGNISGKGLGVDYGLWGVLGTGVFIEDSIRILDTDNRFLNSPVYSLGASNFHQTQTFYTTISVNYPLSAGATRFHTWVVGSQGASVVGWTDSGASTLAPHTDYHANYAGMLIQFQVDNDGQWRYSGYLLPNGSSAVTDIRIATQFNIANTSGATRWFTSDGLVTLAVAEQY